MLHFTSLFFILISVLGFSQINTIDSLQVEKKDTLKNSVKDEEIYAEIKKANTPTEIKTLNPTKAGLYSAVLPGLGQYYNKKYWKIPIVWGAIGAGVGITLWNQKQYTRYRDAFVAELNGLPHEFSDIPGITAEVLGRTQDRAKRQRDYAIAITSLVYVLNIIDAVVDAQLYEGRHDPDLAIKPTLIYDKFGKQNTKAGIALSFNF